MKIKEKITKTIQERLKEKKFTKKYAGTYILLLLGNMLLLLTIWLQFTYDHVSIDQILYQIQTPSDGAQRNLTLSLVLCVVGAGVLLTWLEIVFTKKIHILFSILMLTASAVFFLNKVEVIDYMETAMEDSDFIRYHYTDPAKTKLTFPQQKRNLIYIFLESMENTYADPSASGPIITNFIPELTALANTNVSFSNTTRVGGAYVYTGSTWTAAAMVTQTSGVTIKVPLDADTYSGENGYMPGIVSIGEILEKEGYHQTLLLGSDAAFASRDSYFTEHGNYEIVDINTLKEQGRLPEDYHEWWGFEDEKLFQFAKEELTRLAESGEPFNLTMLTADTHFPDGYVCSLCEDHYEEQYNNVLSCSSEQIYDFISWIQEQPFYENTTIVLSGDHFTMDPTFLDDIDEDYVRTIYNCFINSAVEPVQEKNREFATFDMFPTTLAAMGVKIEGEHLGLGTNLFSDEKTLTEYYGYELLDEELQKNSDFYNTKFLAMEDEE